MYVLIYGVRCCFQCIDKFVINDLYAIHETPWINHVTDCGNRPKCGGKRRSLSAGGGTSRVPTMLQYWVWGPLPSAAQHYDFHFTPKQKVSGKQMKITFVCFTPTTFNGFFYTVSKVHRLSERRPANALISCFKFVHVSAVSGQDFVLLSTSDIILMS